MTSVAHAVYRPVRAYDEQPESIVRTEHTQRSERESEWKKEMGLAHIIQSNAWHSTVSNIHIEVNTYKLGR